MQKSKILLGGLALAAVGLGVLVMSEGESHAASASPGLVGGSPASRALLAIGTANSGQIQSAALVLANEAPEIAAGLVRAAQVVRALETENTDRLQLKYRAFVLQTISGLDVPSIMAQAANLQNERLQDHADGVRGLATFIQWLKDGANSKKAETAVTAQSPAPAIVSEVAKATDTNEQEAAKIAAIIATGSEAKIAAAIEVYTRAGNQRAVDVLNVALAELRKRTAVAVAPDKPVEAVVKAVEVAKTEAAQPPAAKETPKVEVAPEKPERVLAGKVALALKTATKSKATGLPVPDSARLLTKQFQAQEKLARVDGAYGTETALSLAERYGIVPPNPLSWGKRDGNYKTLTADKKLYIERLEKLRDSDPPRREEWQRAISQVKP